MRRCTQLLSSLLLGSVGILTASAVALAGGGGGGGGGNGLPAAGNSTITTLSADYFSVDDPVQGNFSVDVTQRTTATNPLVGPSTVSSETDVFFDECSPGLGCNGSCFVLSSPGDFVIASDLSSASINTTVTAVTQACQFNPPPPVGLTLNVTWSGTGPVSTNNKIDTYGCGSAYTAEVQGMSTNNNSTGAGTATPSVTTSLAAQGASLGSGRELVHAQGVPQDACESFGLLGGGKGAGGPGPIGPGQFQFENQNASVNLSSGFLNASTFSSTSHPFMGPVTSSTGTQIQLFTFFPFFADFCWAPNPGTFTFTITSSGAHLVAAIDSTTPSCPFFPPNNFVSPFTIDITWTGVGPDSMLRGTDTAACSGLHSESTSTQTLNPTNVSGTVPGFGDAFTGASGFLFSGANNFKLQGQATPGCVFRP